MMFVISKERIVRNYPFEVPRAIDGGKQEIHRLEADFRLLPRSERKDGSDIELLRKVVLTVKPLQDEAGAAVAFTPEILDLLLEDDAVAIALLAAYAQACAGGARRKN